METAAVVEEVSTTEIEEDVSNFLQTTGSCASLATPSPSSTCSSRTSWWTSTTSPSMSSSRALWWTSTACWTPQPWSLQTARLPATAAEEDDGVVMVQLREAEVEELSAVTVPRDVRAFLNEYFVETTGHANPNWSLQLGVCVVDAMLEQLGVLRCLLAERAGRPCSLPPEPVRDQCAAGCVPLCRALSAAQWEAAMDVVRNARCDPDLLPGRLHGVVGSASSTGASACGVGATGTSASEGGVAGELQS